MEKSNKKFEGFLFAKLGRIGTRSEGPDYYLQIFGRGGTSKDILIAKKTHLWQEDPKLHHFLAQKVVITGDMEGDALGYTDIYPMRAAA